ncbi:MAG: hypothetical protein HY068_05540 [Burkholderiales bacterium]|nr:hypothetical protein [Burkholderiales bacterium]
MAPTRTKFNQAIAFLANWGWPAKFLLGASVSAFAGGSVLGFLLQNAAYYFALSYGFRPPVEGVPYLVAMVTFGSISLLLLAAVLAAAFVALAKSFGLAVIEWLDAKSSRFSGTPSILGRYRALSAWVVVSFLLIIGAVWVWIDFLFLPQSPPFQVCAWPILLCLPENNESLLAMCLKYSIFVVMGLMLWRPSLVWMGALFMVTFQYLWIAANVLPPDGYARLLRMTGFGGGLEVEVDLRASDASSIKTMKANLLIRSDTTLFLYSPSEQFIREYQTSEIREIRYREGGLHTLPVRLPKATALMQR